MNSVFGADLANFPFPATCSEKAATETRKLAMQLDLCMYLTPVFDFVVFEQVGPLDYALASMLQPKP